MSRRRLVAIVLGVLLVVVLGSSALLARDALAARDALEGARAHLDGIQETLLGGDVEGARAAVTDARVEVDRALGRTDGPIWAAAGRLPVAGDTPTAVRRVVEVADAAVDVAEAAVAGADGVLGEDGELSLAFVGDEVDLGAIRALGAVVSDLPTATLQARRDALTAVPTDRIPATVRDGRRDTLELADRVLASLEQASAAARVLPSFLGVDGPRRYLLAMQNPAELRGTGGLIGLFTIIRAEAGRLEVEVPADYDEVEDALDSINRPAADAPDDFVARYGRVDATRFLNNVNVDPDLPTTAPVLMDLFRVRGGGDVDGVIVLDPVGLSQLLSAIGPVDLPSGLVDDARIPDPVPAEELPRVAMVEAYEVFGGETEDRRAFLQALALGAFQRITDGDWDPVAVGHELGRAASERHLQLHSTRPDEQADLVRLGLAGALATDPGRDLLAVTANNAGANKQDVHVGHAMELDLQLTPGTGAPGDALVAGDRRVTVTTSVLNPLPTTGMHEWIIGSARPGEAFSEGLQGEPGLNRTWWTVWAPLGTRPVAAVGGDGDAIGVTLGELHGQVAVDHFLSTPSREERSWTLELDGPVVLRRVGEDLVYDLTLWRQAKAIPDDVELTVSAPGWRVVDVTVTGGGEPDRLPFTPDPRPDVEALTASVVDGAARVVGERVTDVHVSVRLARAR